MKLNNRGFAISTLIYGLSILGILLITMIMSTMSSNRSNASLFSDAVQKDLDAYSRSAITFKYEGSDNYSEQVFNVPEGEEGWYRIELWGGQGNNGSGGRGAYTTGIIKLDDDNKIYFYIGKGGSLNEGGYATSVQVSTGDGKTRIMTAGGGGVESGGTSIKRYKISSQGGIVQSGDDYVLNSGTDLLNASYNNIDSNIFLYAPWDVAGDTNSGTGYYDGLDGAGGTSFISGYAGSVAYLEDGSRASYFKSGDNNYIFYDGLILDGVRSGNGLARIERISTGDKLPRANKKLNNVRYIRDCCDDASTTSIIAMSNGEAVAGSGSKSGNCYTFTLNKNVDLDEVAVWHDGGSGKDYSNHTIAVSSNGSNYNYIKDKSGSVASSVTEGPNGIHISAYQPDYTSSGLPTGNYYIFPVTSNYKVLSSYLNESEKDKELKFSELTGDNTSEWSIRHVPSKVGKENVNNEYRIEDLVRFDALTINLDENRINNKLVSNTPFNELTRNTPQIWMIQALGNGTYQILSTVSTFSSSSGGLMAMPDDSISIATNTSINVARFNFYKID